jgi:4-hydroxy-tetrahydrodipicolinate synthase
MASSFDGVYAAALTPLREDLSIDRRVFAAHCRRLLGEGCDGLAIFGTTGEANSFSVSERVTAWEALVADGIPGHALLPGTGACALTDAVTLTREALAAGARGMLALPPFYYKDVSDDGLFGFFAELIERVGDDGLRLFLYHILPRRSSGSRSS